MTPLERFEAKVSRLPSGCWEWQGYRNPKGYGQVGVNGKVSMAHRVAWERFNGRAVPLGLLILHRCDNPPCVNPDHLYAGTAKQNTADMLDRRRNKHPRGLRNGRAKLSDQDVERIRDRATAGESKKSIARELGLDASYVGRLVRKVRR